MGDLQWALQFYLQEVMLLKHIIGLFSYQSLVPGFLNFKLQKLVGGFTSQSNHIQVSSDGLSRLQDQLTFHRSLPYLFIAISEALRWKDYAYPWIRLVYKTFSEQCGTVRYFFRTCFLCDHPPLSRNHFVPDNKIKQTFSY